MSVHPQSGAISVTDRRTKQTWQQSLLETNIAHRQRVVSTDPQQREIRLECDLEGLTPDWKTRPATFRIVARLHASRPDLELKFTLKEDGEWRQAAYPYNFALDGDDARNLYPHGEGLLVPARRQHPDWLELPSEYLYGGTLSYMMCLGLVQMNSGAGLLTLLPDFESTKIQWRNVAGEAGEVVVPQIVWDANKHRFDRSYTMTYCFSSQGGYVALAKRYRTFFAEKGLHKTLREKAAVNPALKEIAGAPIFWAAGKTPHEVRQAADILRSNGVDRCLFAMPMIFEPQANYPNQQALVDVVRHVRSLGYQTYRYDQFRDAFRKDPAQPAPLQINYEAWPALIVRQENGQMVQAFGTNSGVICSDFFLPLARKSLPQEIKTFGYTAWFLDCIGSVTYNFESECWDPRHPCNKFDTRREREGLLQYANELGRLVGTECGVDYVIPEVHWFEGAATLVRWVGAIHPPEIDEATNINGTVTDSPKGEMDRVRQLPLNATPTYTVDLGTKWRIPFYSLAHHDEVIVTWRWEHGMNSPAAYWKRKNLWSVLYGAPPMYRQPLDVTKSYQKEIGQTQRYVSEWVRQIAFDEMVDHQSITPDLKVQESLFSSGRGVVVNFGTNDFVLPGGPKVPANDYVTFRLGDARRVYQAANGPNLFTRE